MYVVIEQLCLNSLPLGKIRGNFVHQFSFLVFRRFSSVEQSLDIYILHITFNAFLQIDIHMYRILAFFTEISESAVFQINSFMR